MDRSAEPVYLGVDVGSTATKALVLDAQGCVRARAVTPSGTDFFAAARTVVDEAVGAGGSAHVARTVATGYGRKNLPFADAAITEISCHAAGALRALDPPFTLVDIGGQDNKVVQVGAGGAVDDFTMNRKCAAGTGAFLEEIARRLELPVEAMEARAREAADEAAIGSFCTVFAATEILNLFRRGTSVPAIARGALRSVVKRVLEMGTFRGRVALSGGVVAHNPLVAKLFAEETGAETAVLPDPQFTGALGAAWKAKETAP